MSMLKKQIVSKVTMIGSGQAGKTSILLRLIDDTFNKDCEPTIFENKMITIVVEQIPISLHIWDTAGQEDFNSIIPLTYESTEIAIICYSVDDSYSYEAVTEKWENEVRYYSENVEIVLVATKTDLRSDGRVSCLENEDGKRLAKQINAIAFFECSAKDSIGVSEIFNFVAKHIYAKKVVEQPAKNKKKKGFFSSLFQRCC
ncbi:small GTP-binding protein domain [Vavraia culicis subsp. floridensis]|uniref:Small GTP-binding protein domain n=1 Tax=Vavraia culicis (isolate floridensis) TaxID=948595 RepID=L2GWG4_VAVCU|nr:small GTP-binding protein domain [Vavraia culicis subsp. floridensis]ELA47964.1 small GTP-binding protein domain [Vavraia culicis subsp. floridensis]